MKEFKINNKNFLQSFSAFSVIVLTFIANGFLSFLVVDFDFSKIWTTAFWANFAIMFISEMAVLLSIFYVQKLKDLQHNKIIKLQKHIENERRVIYEVDKVTEAEEWLRNVYNYRERLLIFEEKVKRTHEKIVPKKPKEDSVFYNFKNKCYKKKIAKKEFCLKQLQFIKWDKQKIKLLTKKNKTEKEIEILKTYDLLLENKDYVFITLKINYKIVYWGHLLSDCEDVKNKDNSPHYSEKKELSKNTIKYLASGAVITAFLSAILVPAMQQLSSQAWLNIILNIIVLVFFMGRGILLSNKIILGTYYKALEKRKSIYSQMLLDLDVSQVEIEEETGVENEQ